MGKRTAIYLRSSKDRHDVSVESQRHELREHVAKEGHVLVAEFEDKVESAKTANRPGFQEMIAEARSVNCRFEQIICFDTSRFSRRIYDAQMYKHLLEKEGIGLRFLKLPQTDPLMDGVIESLMQIFDEFHSRKSKYDGLRGMRQNVRNGYRAGGPALFGYRLEKEVVAMREGEPVYKSRMVPDPVQAPIAKAFLEARAAGEARRSICDRLGIELSASVLSYMEHSAQIYAGHMIWNRHNERVDGRYVGGSRFRDPSEWVVMRDNHEPLISQQVADAVEGQLKQGKQMGRRRRKSSYLLSGLLRCKCGAAMHGNAGYYRCAEKCGARSVKQERAEAAVLEVLLDDLLSDEFLNELKAEAEKALEQGIDQSAVQRRQLEREISRLDGELKGIVEVLTKTTVQRPLIERMEAVETERREAEKALSELSESNSARASITDGDVREFVVAFRKGLTDPDAEKRKGFVRDLVACATLDSEELRVEPNVPAITGVKVALPRGLEPRFSP